MILIYEELLKRGISMDRLRAIHSPLGLDIHARTPEEIAVSIMAEIIQVRLGGLGQTMKLPERQLKRIHSRVLKEQAEATSAR